MSAYHDFAGRVVPMEWGKSGYTVLPLPGAVAAALATGGAKRVEGEFAEHPVNLALTRAPVIDAVFVYTGKRLMREIGIAPGQDVEVRLRAADPDRVVLPDDLARALSRAGRVAGWDAMRPGEKRARLATLERARKPETRARRIAALVDGLQGA